MAGSGAESGLARVRSALGELRGWRGPHASRLAEAKRTVRERHPKPWTILPDLSEPKPVRTWVHRNRSSLGRAGRKVRRAADSVSLRFSEVAIPDRRRFVAGWILAVAFALLLSWGG